eukprot:8630946-Pyramimonas_sp.AAC.1
MIMIIITIIIIIFIIIITPSAVGAHGAPAPSVRSRPCPAGDPQAGVAPAVEADAGDVWPRGLGPDGRRGPHQRVVRLRGQR